MKPEVAALLRAVVKLTEEDLTELRDAVAQIDHKAGEAWHAYKLRDDKLMQLAEDLDALRTRVTTVENSAWVNHKDHSRGV